MLFYFILFYFILFHFILFYFLYYFKFGMVIFGNVSTFNLFMRIILLYSRVLNEVGSVKLIICAFTFLICEIYVSGFDLTQRLV